MLMNKCKSKKFLWLCILSTTQKVKLFLSLCIISYWLIVNIDKVNWYITTLLYIRTVANLFRHSFFWILFLFKGEWEFMSEFRPWAFLISFWVAVSKRSFVFCFKSQVKFYFKTGKASVNRFSLVFIIQYCTVNFVFKFGWEDKKPKVYPLPSKNPASCKVLPLWMKPVFVLSTTKIYILRLMW